jgi:hypothetical protein
MSAQFKAFDPKKANSSKIQVEVKNISQPKPSHSTRLPLSVDGDGGDASNE